MDQAFPPSRQAPLAEELARHIAREVDFLAEADAAARMRAQFADDAVPGVRVPEVLAELSTTKVLTMEYVAGERLGELLSRLRDAGDDAAIERLLTRLVQAYFLLLARCGFFQADPHPGNFLVEDGDRLALIDFGCCKELPDERRSAFLNLGSALLMGHEPTIQHWFREAGFTTTSPAAEQRLARIAAFLTRQMSSGRFEHDVTPEQAFADFVANLGIHPPTDAALLGRVFMALGGLLRTYAPRLNLLAIVAPYVIAAALKPPSRAAGDA
jgi:ubiquinone biosynthesis protein